MTIQQSGAQTGPIWALRFFSAQGVCFTAGKRINPLGRMEPGAKLPLAWWSLGFGHKVHVQAQD